MRRRIDAEDLSMVQRRCRIALIDLKRNTRAKIHQFIHFSFIPTSFLESMMSTEMTWNPQVDVKDLITE
jgi:hypothetical protein